MPSSYPFPSVARLALSLFISTKKIQALPVMTEVQPWERAAMVATFDNGVSEAF